jgi:hypothetical protein
LPYTPDHLSPKGVFENKVVASKEE